MSARTLAEQSPSTRHRARVVKRERAARTREEQSPSTRDWARAANREQIAGTRAVQSPCTRDRARVVERERSADAFSSLLPFQQRTQQLGEDLRRLEPLQSNRPRCLFPDELHNNHANQGDAGSVRVSGVGMCEHGHVNGLHQRGGGGGVHGEDVDGEGSGGGRSEAASLRYGVHARSRRLPALFSIAEPHVSQQYGGCLSFVFHAKQEHYLVTQASCGSSIFER